MSGLGSITNLMREVEELQEDCLASQKALVDTVKNLAPLSDRMAKIDSKIDEAKRTVTKIKQQEKAATSSRKHMTEVEKKLDASLRRLEGEIKKVESLRSRWRSEVKKAVQKRLDEELEQIHAKTNKVNTESIKRSNDLDDRLQQIQAKITGEAVINRKKITSLSWIQALVSAIAILALILALSLG